MAALFSKAERGELFNSEEFEDLSRDDPQALVSLRGNRIVGDAYQSWVDEDELSAFLASK